MPRTGGQILCSSLQQLGVKHIFGLPGTQNVGFFECLRQSSIRTIVPTHELAAGFMANGYYRASGKVGVLTTIPGPGFAFTIAAIAEASHDSAALLYIVGKAAVNPDRKYNLQAIDQRAILSPLVRKIVEVDHPHDLAAGVREAFTATTAGEPGPVMLQIDDRHIAEEVAPPPEFEAPLPIPKSPDAATLREIIASLRESKRAVLFVGQGTNGAPDRLQKLASLLSAPVIATRSARGVISEDDPKALTFDFSESSIRSMNLLFDQSDLILAIGCKFSANGAFGFKLKLAPEKLIHVDSCAEVLNANYPARIALHSGAPEFLDAIVRNAEAFQSRSSDWNPAMLEACRPRAANPVEPAVHGCDPATPAGFFDALRKAMPANACLVTDSGLHQVLATRHFRVHTPRGLIIPTDFQSMGFGLPAAIGAKLADPSRRVILIVGDGGLAMSGMEILTAVREKIPITIIVFNDGALGQIRAQQLSSYGHSHGTALLNPDLPLFAEAIGANYFYLDGDAENTLRAAINQSGVTLVEVGLGDSTGMRVERAKGFARQGVRRMVSPSVLGWIKSRLRGARTKSG